jgi:hypothetical protein
MMRLDLIAPAAWEEVTPLTPSPSLSYFGANAIATTGSLLVVLCDRDANMQGRIHMYICIFI